MDKLDQIPCKDCIVFPICNGKIQSDMSKPLTQRVVTVKDLANNCPPLFDYLFNDNSEGQWIIPKYKQTEFRHLFKICQWG